MRKTHGVFCISCFSAWVYSVTGKSRHATTEGPLFIDTCSARASFRNERAGRQHGPTPLSLSLAGLKPSTRKKRGERWVSEWCVENSIPTGPLCRVLSSG